MALFDRLLIVVGLLGVLLEHVLQIGQDVVRLASRPDVLRPEGHPGRANLSRLQSSLADGNLSRESMSRSGNPSSVRPALSQRFGQLVLLDLSVDHRHVELAGVGNERCPQLALLGEKR